MKSRIFLSALTAALLAMLAACTTSAAIERNGMSTIPIAEANYDVLGRIKFEDNIRRFHFPILSAILNKGDRTIVYYKLLEEARKQYPQADDIVNITVDFEGKKIFFYETGKYITTGLAIQYLSTVKDEEARK